MRLSSVGAYPRCRFLAELPSEWRGLGNVMRDRLGELIYLLPTIS
jgi:hypothetical protein